MRATVWLTLPRADFAAPVRASRVCAVMAAVVSMTISRNWTGSDVYWLAFTLGLTFAALVLLANVIMQIVQADNDR